MKYMRWRTILLVLWLALLFNVERLDFEGEAALNLASFVYLLTLAIVGLFLLVPLTRRQMYVTSLGALSVYLVCKALSGVPLFLGTHKYLTVTEIVALLITIGLSWYVSHALHDFEGAVEAISLPEGRQQLLPYDMVQERMRAEMGRARRHQRPISVAMIDLDPSTFEAALHAAVREAQAAMIARYVQMRLGLFLSKHIRGTDVIAHHAEDGRFLLLAPETPAEQTTEMLNRLAQQVADQMGIRFRYSVADFPSAALTSEELLRRVTEDLQRASFVPYSAPVGAALEPALSGDGARVYTALSMVQENGRDEMRLTRRVGD